MPSELAREGGGERFGKFQLSKRLGAGVSHDLWQAWDPEKQAWLALRVWPRPAPGAKELVLAAGKKARAAADPRIVPPAGGGLEAGQLWYARPYFEALPVKDLPWQDGRTLARVAKECAEALAGAHEKGLVHGRVTAGNVLVSSRKENADEVRRGPKGEGGWVHEVKVTEFGLEEGDAAGDARGLGRVFCELTGQPAPGGGPTTKAAPGTSGDTTSVSQVKGDTTRDASSEGRIVIDGALAGIFLRARDGQLDAAAIAAELGAWLDRKPAAPKRRGAVIAVAVAITVVVVTVVAIAFKSKGGPTGAGEALAESARAEAEGRLEAALERARAAAAADPKDARVADAVRRLEAAVAARDALLSGARSTADAALEADKRLKEARLALRGAQEAASAPQPVRATVDKPLSAALAAIEAVLRVRPGDASALRLLEDAATLFEPGDLSRLPRDAEGRPIMTPLLVIRADLSSWIFSCWGPRGLGRARPDRPEASYRISLFPAPSSPAGTPTTPLPAPDPAAPGRVARLLADGPPRAGEPALAAAWRGAVRALLAIDDGGALTAARSVAWAADDPLAADMEWILGSADPRRCREQWSRARAARPWDPMFLLSCWVERRSEGEHEEALAIAKNAVALFPGSIDLLTARAWSYSYTYRYDEALADVAAANQDPAAHLVAALVYFGQRKQKECEAACSDALRMDPQMVLALVYRAEVRQRRRDPKGALEDAEAAVQMDPGRVDAIQVRAYARSSLGDRSGAMADCERSIVLSPYDAESYRIRGWVHVHSGEYEEGIKDADIALKMGGRDSQTLALRAMAKLSLGRDAEAVADAEEALQINSMEAKAEVVLGTACLRRAKQAEATEHCGRALRISPGLPEALRLRALISASHDAKQEAIADATEVLEAWPKDVGMLLVRARARLGTGQLSGAMEDCEAILEVNPRMVDALIARARIKGAMRATGVAIEEGAVIADLDRALALEPKNLEALIAKAAQLSLAGRNREAAETMTKTLDASPGAVELLVLRAGYRELAGDVEGAMADAETLIRDAPRSSEGYYRRSSLMMKKGDLEAALLDAVDGTRAEPRNARIWRQLGDVYRAKNQKERAIEAYEQVVRMTAAGDAERAAAETAIVKLKAK